jgi:hypothetical protein
VKVAFHPRRIFAQMGRDSDAVVWRVCILRPFRPELFLPLDCGDQYRTPGSRICIVRQQSQYREWECMPYWCGVICRA